LSFDFVGLNYQSPEKNRYAYKLEGVDTDWVDSGTRRYANYTELSPGTYVFRVKASNDDGLWNTQGASITITIASPWWSTWWARLAYVLIGLGAVWAFIQYRSRALQQEKRVLEQKVTERTKQVQLQKEEIEVQRDNLKSTLTELKAIQNQLIQKEKMASLGELTAGIAHEIQNPLNFVNNFSEVSAELLEELEEEQQKPERDPDWEATLLTDLRANMHKIAQHGQRAAAIVRGMLEHSRTSTGEVQPTNLNGLVEEYIGLAYRAQQAKDNSFTCAINKHFDSTIGDVALQPQEIGRALLNLFTNAFYAVSERQKQADADYQPTVSVATTRTAAGVEIRISDNGTGIPETIRQKIFQPFFTTKPTGEGTGLGLSLTYDIITKGHGGTLSLTSQEGQASEFTISLPA
jgi:signal transduction histidine kinase